MLRRSSFLLLLFQLFALAPAQAELFWHTDLNGARQRAVSSSRRILVFFAAPGTSLTRYHETLFSQPEVERELASSWELVRVDFAASPDLARALQVYRGGTLSLFSSDGTALGRVQRELPAGEFLQVLRSAPGENSPGRSTSRDEETTEVPSVPSVPAPGIRKGALVAGPFDAHLRSSEFLPFGTLEKGRTYILTLSGRGSIWSGRTDGIDPLYIFRLDTKKGRIQPSRLVRVGDKETPLAEFVRHMGGSMPEYNAGHAYDVVIPGTGEPLNLILWDGGGERQADNAGSFRIALHEAEGTENGASVSR